jgi:hypothetical protein
MLAFVRDLDQPVRYDPNYHNISRSVEQSLPNQFNIEFAAVETRGDGNCYYNAVSIALVGTDILNGVLRFLSLAMGLKYKDEIEKRQDSFQRRIDYRQFLFGIGVPRNLEQIALEYYPQWTRGTFNWANEQNFSLVGIAIKRTIQLYTAGQIRYRDVTSELYRNIPNTWSLAQLNGIFINMILSLKNNTVLF